jgi:hypothetical protein
MSRSISCKPDCRINSGVREGDVAAVRMPMPGTTFNALEAQFQNRFSHGLQTLVAFTWEKCLGDSNGDFNAENGSEALPTNTSSIPGFPRACAHITFRSCSTGARCISFR